MEKFSVLLGKTEREKHYKILRQRIIQYFEEKYLKNGELIFNTQTSYLLPLAFDMLEGENRENAVSKLREAVEKNDFTLSTGIRRNRYTESDACPLSDLTIFVMTCFFRQRIRAGCIR